MCVCVCVCVWAWPAGAGDKGARTTELHIGWAAPPPIWIQSPPPPPGAIEVQSVPPTKGGAISIWFPPKTLGFLSEFHGNFTWRLCDDRNGVPGVTNVPAIGFTWGFTCGRERKKKKSGERERRMCAMGKKGVLGIYIWSRMWMRNDVCCRDLVRNTNRCLL